MVNFVNGQNTYNNRVEKTGQSFVLSSLDIPLSFYNLFKDFGGCNIGYSVAD